MVVGDKLTMSDSEYLNYGTNEDKLLEFLDDALSKTGKYGNLNDNNLYNLIYHEVLLHNDYHEYKENTVNGKIARDNHFTFVITPYL